VQSAICPNKEVAVASVQSGGPIAARRDAATKMDYGECDEYDIISSREVHLPRLSEWA